MMGNWCTSSINATSSGRRKRHSLAVLAFLCAWKGVVALGVCDVAQHAMLTSLADYPSTRRYIGENRQLTDVAELIPSKYGILELEVVEAITWALLFCRRPFEYVWICGLNSCSSSRWLFSVSTLLIQWHTSHLSPFHAHPNGKMDEVRPLRWAEYHRSSCRRSSFDELRIILNYLLYKLTKRLYICFFLLLIDYLLICHPTWYRENY